MGFTSLEDAVSLRREHIKTVPAHTRMLIWPMNPGLGPDRVYGRMENAQVPWGNPEGFSIITDCGPRFFRYIDVRTYKTGRIVKEEPQKTLLQRVSDKVKQYF